MEGLLQTSGSRNNVILLGAGSEESVERSEVHLDAEAAAATAIPGLARPLGSTAASGEIVYMAPLTLETGQKEQSLLRGVTEKALLVHTRMCPPGTFPAPARSWLVALMARHFGVSSDALAPANASPSETPSLPFPGSSRRLEQSSSPRRGSTATTSLP